jgi:UDP-GlcNAc:undecaprenyl-phosphate GlcNAc-1-phosphate transferase
MMACVFAMNFMDGADGLAAGTAAIIATGYAALPAGVMSGMGATLSWSLLGAFVGFLAFNLPPRASIFMGDSGSTLLGYSLAYLALDFYSGNRTGHPNLLFPILIAAVPLLDAALAIVRRLRKFRSRLFGYPLHFYELLSSRGEPPWRILLASYSVTALLVIVGWLTLRMNIAEELMISALSVGALLAAALRLGALSSTKIVRGRRRETLSEVDRTLLPVQKRNDFSAG